MIGEVMLSIFQRSTKPELEDIIRSLESNRANNYKDNAQADYKKLVKVFEELKSDNKLNDKQIARYGQIISEYKSMLNKYTHKDQTPYWT